MFNLLSGGRQSISLKTQNKTENHIDVGVTEGLWIKHSEQSADKQRHGSSSSHTANNLPEEGMILQSVHSQRLNTVRATAKLQYTYCICVCVCEWVGAEKRMV